MPTKSNQNTNIADTISTIFDKKNPEKKDFLAAITEIETTQNYIEEPSTKVAQRKQKSGVIIDRMKDGSGNWVYEFFQKNNGNK